MNNSEVKLDELTLIHKLEKLHQYLHGAYSVCEHKNSSETFDAACDVVIDIIDWIESDD